MPGAMPPLGAQIRGSSTQAISIGMRESMLPRERRKRDGSCKSLGYRTEFFDRYVVFQLDHGTGWVFRLTRSTKRQAPSSFDSKKHRRFGCTSAEPSLITSLAVILSIARGHATIFELRSRDTRMGAAPHLN